MSSLVPGSPLFLQMPLFLLRLCTSLFLDGAAWVGAGLVTHLGRHLVCILPHAPAGPGCVGIHVCSTHGLSAHGRGVLCTHSGLGVQLTPRTWPHA